MRTFFLYLLLGNLLIINSGMAQSPVLGRDSLLLIQSGIASFYAEPFHNRRTASGKIFNMHAFTAAHKNLPFGTMLKVTKLNNGYQVIVEVNDRLPQNSRRIIDLSRGAAEHLDMIQEGIAKVKIYALSVGAVKKLREYYNKIPNGMRLRLYYQPVSWTKPPKPKKLRNKMIFKENIKPIGIYSLLK